MSRAYFVAAAVAALAAVVLGALAWGWHRAYQAGAQSVRIEWAQRDAKMAEDARLLARERATHIERIDHAAVTQSRAVRAAAVSAAVAGDGLRIRAQAVASRCDAGPASGGETTGTPGSVLADVLERLEARGREMAATADERGIAGSACEAAFDAVTDTKSGTRLPENAEHFAER